MDCQGQNAYQQPTDCQVQIPWSYKLPDKIKQLTIPTWKESGEGENKE